MQQSKYLRFNKNKETGVKSNVSVVFGRMFIVYLSQEQTL